MERSTWVSAAKLTMASTPSAAAVDRLSVADVGLDEAVAGVVGHDEQVVQVARVGELVQVDDLERRDAGQHAPDEGAADEAGAAADEELRRQGAVGVRCRPDHRLTTPQS